jgi:hypothetical protein
MAVHVQCNNCGAWGITEDHEFPDGVVQCTSPKDDPKGSPAGSCCTDHESLEHHLAEARRAGDSRCRPVTVTIMGTQHGRPGGGVTLQGAS